MLNSNDTTIKNCSLQKTQPQSTVSHSASPWPHEDEQLEPLRRETRNILNKLTHANLQRKAIEHLTQLTTTEERLNACVSVIVAHAVDEPSLAALLAKMLAPVEVPSSSGEPNKTVRFRSELLKNCQKTFNTCNSEQYKQGLRALNDDEELTKAKHRSIGNVRFIGELFQLDMLTEGIMMNDCIEHLLKLESDEDNLERLCHLLTVIGKKLDKPDRNAATKMNGYFEHMARIARNKELAIRPRVRFMLLDVIELRKNAWLPRHLIKNTNKSLVVSCIH